MLYMFSDLLGEVRAVSKKLQSASTDLSRATELTASFTEMTTMIWSVHYLIQLMNIA